MRYKAKNIAALQIALGGLPDTMRVELEADIGASPKTVGELRRLAAWPENLAITTPQEGDPNSVVKVSKANVALARRRSPREPRREVPRVMIKFTFPIECLVLASDLIRRELRRYSKRWFGPGASSFLIHPRHMIAGGFRDCLRS